VINAPFVVLFEALNQQTIVSGDIVAGGNGGVNLWFVPLNENAILRRAPYFDGDQLGIACHGVVRGIAAHARNSDAVRLAN
jgi:hypothetical protein